MILVLVFLSLLAGMCISLDSVNWFMTQFNLIAPINWSILCFFTLYFFFTVNFSFLAASKPIESTPVFNWFGRCNICTLLTNVPLSQYKFYVFPNLNAKVAVNTDLLSMRQGELTFIRR